MCPIHYAREQPGTYGALSSRTCASHRCVYSLIRPFAKSLYPDAPFTLHTDPVVYVLRSEHKNSITSATSLGSEYRPN
jgi:hypothetical protein